MSREKSFTGGLAHISSAAPSNLKQRNYVTAGLLLFDLQKSPTFGGLVLAILKVVFPDLGFSRVGLSIRGTFSRERGSVRSSPGIVRGRWTPPRSTPPCRRSSRANCAKLARRWPTSSMAGAPRKKLAALRESNSPLQTWPCGFLPKQVLPCSKG